MSGVTEQTHQPGWSLTRWLVDPGGDLPGDMRRTLIHSLYASIPIFLGGVFNTVAVSSLVAARMPTALFLAWAGFEILLAIVRLPILIAGRRALARGEMGPTDIYIALAVLWAGSVGFGTFISMLSGDWVAATLACLSSAAMVGGICFRNFAAPRLVAVMIVLSLGPAAVAGAASGEPILWIAALQIPFYLFSMTAAAFHLNRMLVRTMKAERAQDHNARHDPLTKVLNRSGLSRWVEERTLPDGVYSIFFLDLDGFKQVNDTMGHSAGDKLLCEVADRLKALAGPGDAIARLGGDEFVFVTPEGNARKVRELGEEIIATLRHGGYGIDERLVFTSASAGAASYPADGGTLEDLLEAADRALYQAKALGGSGCVLASAMAGRSAFPERSFRLVVDNKRASSAT